MMNQPIDQALKDFMTTFKMAGVES